MSLPRPNFALVVVIAALSLGCSPAPGDGTPEDSGADPALPTVALDRARSAADSLGSSLLEHLGQAMEAGGPARAIRVCSETAQQIAEKQSMDGLLVRRVSLEYRNPANRPDPFEESALRELQVAHDRGELPREMSTVVEDEAGRRLRYLRPIVVGEVCLSCHGGPEELDPQVAALLPELYPDDRAIGYSQGDLRGAFSVTVALD